MIHILIIWPKVQIFVQEQISTNKEKKATSFFLGLESNRGTKSCIRKVFTSDGTLTTNPKKISMEMVKFFSDLCPGNNEEVDESHPFLLRPEIPKRTSEMKNICEGKLSVKECFDCLQSFE